MGFGLFFILLILIIAALVADGFYIVKQQHAVFIERLGKFNRFTGAGFHVKIPVIERKAAVVSLRTMKNGFKIDAKTADNVTIGLEVSAQYHVDYAMGNAPYESGIYKSFYMLQEPEEQMKDFITDALRSAIPTYSLDEVFAKKDDIARDVNNTVSSQMSGYGFTLVSTLITRIALPREVEDSMNQINSAQRTRLAAQDLAEADRIKTVTEAIAEAESMEKAGEGIALQRKAIAQGIKDSLETIKESGVTPQEANQLFMFTQWADMMSRFADQKGGSTVVLPNDFSATAGMFEQMLVAQKADDEQ
ncbi:FtsH protease regulator HflK [Slackia heliotrinireducens]|uniref:SPFH domain-containing protein n=1 Tax=Slackia heliotrinireducens TaxID=84110 RepID=UPI000F715857|nr:SPFH domain-containing protein [Slackia heliotrinireducens]VEH03176.1 FtsH protease regulator HflK [Slackia heliotrinireducens]